MPTPSSCNVFRRNELVMLQQIEQKVREVQQQRVARDRDHVKPPLPPIFVELYSDKSTRSLIALR
ncbi:hypothetical protein PILCRDRAFT_814438 [Piloderma croceum F 1598]|uniref:Uncharacterized protein n=1 Tax=Piloderma croceum (strain F 1598) TaxID=765440 RepID=A0A0C3BMN5_PILCF|nr:hypothetical protein PILCRDRAFT_814438 [Piloderma croceum F 1598]